MEISELLNFASEVGRQLLESGAETSRVEDTLDRIIKHFYSGHHEVLVVMTGLFVNIGTRTKTVRVKNRSINLDRVSKINMLSRDIAESKVDFEEATKRLDKISNMETYPLWLKTLAVAMCCAFFTLLFGGGMNDAVNSFIAGILFYILSLFMRKHKNAEFVITFFSGVIISLFAVAAELSGFSKDTDAMLIGSMMPLFPGLAITNAIRDIIAGDYLSGGARVFDAVVVAVALAAGAASVMYIAKYFYGGI